MAKRKLPKKSAPTQAVGCTVAHLGAHAGNFTESVGLSGGPLQDSVRGADAIEVMTG